MASCANCGVEVAPGDIVYYRDGTAMTQFCSNTCRQAGIEQQMEANRQKVAVKEAAQPPSAPSTPAAKPSRKRQARKR